MELLRPKLIFDTSALIASAQFRVQNRLVLQFIIEYATILVPDLVKDEAIDQGLKSGYADAKELDSLLKAGHISVKSTPPVDPIFESVIKAYGVEDGDQSVLKLCRQTSDYQHVVVDDRLLHLVMYRFEMRPIFLPDLIVLMVEAHSVDAVLADEILTTIKPRYRSGFIEHGRFRLKGVL